jgi:Predicted membrane protein (DUF2127)
MTEAPAPRTPANLPLPGMAIISLWMLAQSGIGAFGVLTHHFPAFVMLLSVAFAAASIGLLRQRRWGWALTLAATFLSMCYGCYCVFRLHQGEAAVMAVVNLVFFLYLVRPEILERVK